MRVLIVGAGAIGTAAALDLARRGVRVTVLDRGRIGGGCSYGNAGWLTPGLATPLPAPGVLTTGLAWLLDPDSPLYIKPSLRPSWLRWMARFALSTGRETFERGTRALVELSRFSRDAYAALDAERPGSFGFSPTGLLEIAQSDGGLAAVHHDAEAMANRGIAVRFLDPAEVVALEPAVKGETAGGALYPGAAHCEPLAAVEAMAAAARDAGATIEEGVEVFGFRTGSAGVAALRTSRGWMEADRVVLATGTWSKDLARQLGLRVPLLGGKGYAITVTAVDPPPRIAIKVFDRRIAITPRAGSVRLAGTLELVDGDESVTERRVEAIVRGARTVLAIAEDPGVVEVWRGLRPCSPDGLPLIGFAPGYENLVVAAGHQMCGLHTAPATGRLVGDLIAGAPPSFDPAPFRVDRF